MLKRVQKSFKEKNQKLKRARKIFKKSKIRFHFRNTLRSSGSQVAPSNGKSNRWRKKTYFQVFKMKIAFTRSKNRHLRPFYRNLMNFASVLSFKIVFKLVESLSPKVFAKPSVSSIKFDLVETFLQILLQFFHKMMVKFSHS